MCGFDTVFPIEGFLAFGLLSSFVIYGEIPTKNREV